MANTLEKRLGDAVQAVHLNKSSYNEFAGFYYRSYDDVISVVKKALKNFSIGLRFKNEHVEVVGERYYAVTSIYIYDLEGDEKGFVAAVGRAREADSKKGMDVAQVTGTAFTYARKYALSGLFLFDDGLDVDSMDNSENEEELSSLKQELENLGVQISNVAVYFKTDEESLTSEQLKKAIEIKKRSVKDERV